MEISRNCSSRVFCPCGLLRFRVSVSLSVISVRSTGISDQNSVSFHSQWLPRTKWFNRLPGTYPVLCAYSSFWRNIDILLQISINIRKYGIMGQKWKNIFRKTLKNLSFCKYTPINVNKRTKPDVVLTSHQRHSLTMIFCSVTDDLMSHQRHHLWPNSVFYTLFRI